MVTIGQAPRVDLTHEIKYFLGDNTEIIEKGALDGMTLEEINSSVNLEEGNVLVSRMSDGRQVKVTEKYILPKVASKISELETDGVKVILLACTAEFPPFKCKSILVKPQTILNAVLSSIAKEKVLGIIVPDKLQIMHAEKHWSNYAKKVIVKAASPYAKIQEIMDTIEQLKEFKIDIVLMDCIGYTFEMKEAVYRNLNVPVILARSIVSKIISELL